MSYPAPLLPPDTASPAGRPAQAERDPMLGRVIAGRFTILGRLGAGAMGTVYRAKQARIGREVAIKILRSDRALDETSRARFLREARANSLLTSPNTVTVFDFGDDDNGDFYLAMELLEGESLGQRLRRLGRFSPAAAVDTARQALRSLAEAHAKGIIHRDLKPDNLFFATTRTARSPEEIVKVLDFGVAKMLNPDGELAMNAVETQAGTVFGTPRYMSPEQAQGKTLDTRSDLYSLGVILYQMLAGRPPFTDDDAVVVMARHIKTLPKPMSETAPEAAVPAEIEAVVMRALSKEPELRSPTAEAMSADLTWALEAAVGGGSPVSSGVRVSIPAEISAETAFPLVVAPRVAPAIAAAASHAPAGAEVAASRPRRGPITLAGVAIAVGVGLVVVLRSTEIATPIPSAPAANGPPATANETPTAPKAPTSPETPAVPEPAAAAAARPHATQTRAPASPSHDSSPAAPAVPRIAPSPSASVTPIHVARPAVRRPDPRATSRSPAPAKGPDVGYGYLE